MGRGRGSYIDLILDLYEEEVDDDRATSSSSSSSISLLLLLLLLLLLVSRCVWACVCTSSSTSFTSYTWWLLLLDFMDGEDARNIFVFIDEGWVEFVCNRDGKSGHECDNEYAEEDDNTGKEEVDDVFR